MLEGGGKTPILSPAELEEIGFRLVVYPLSLVGVSMRAMQVCFLIYYVKHVALFISLFICIDQSWGNECQTADRDHVYIYSFEQKLKVVLVLVDPFAASS